MRPVEFGTAVPLPRRHTFVRPAFYVKSDEAYERSARHCATN